MTQIEPEVVEMIVKRVAECLTEHFDARHDALVRRMEALEKFVQTSAIDIKHDTKFTRLVARQSFADLLGSLFRPETPDEDTLRPIEIDHAVAADPSGGPQRVDLDRYGVVVFLRPGADPAEAWEEVKADLRQERGMQ